MGIAPPSTTAGALPRASNLEMPRFEIVGPITEIETIAFGNSMRRKKIIFTPLIASSLLS